MVIKKHVCVFCFLISFASFIFCVEYSYYTSTELFARYTCMSISLCTSTCLTNVSRKNLDFLLVYCSLLTCPPPSQYLYVQACILPVNYFLTHKQCSCETFIYVGNIYHDPPHSDYCLLPLFVWKLLAFPAIICMCITV